MPFSYSLCHLEHFDPFVLFATIHAIFMQLMLFVYSWCHLGLLYTVCTIFVQIMLFKYSLWHFSIVHVIWGIFILFVPFLTILLLLHNSWHFYAACAIFLQFMPFETSSYRFQAIYMQFMPFFCSLCHLGHLYTFVIYHNWFLNYNIWYSKESSHEPLSQYYFHAMTFY